MNEFMTWIALLGLVSAIGLGIANTLTLFMQLKPSPSPMTTIGTAALFYLLAILLAVISTAASSLVR